MTACEMQNTLQYYTTILECTDLSIWLEDLCIYFLLEIEKVPNIKSNHSNSKEIKVKHRECLAADQKRNFLTINKAGYFVTRSHIINIPCHTHTILFLFNVLPMIQAQS